MSIFELPIRCKSEAGIELNRPNETHTGEMKMKFMLILKATKDSEAGKMPSEETINAMVKYNQEQAAAGVLVDAAGLYPSSTGARVNVAADGKKTVIDGPFTESKELVARLLADQGEVARRSGRVGEAHADDEGPGGADRSAPVY